jgi:hypothetical protein
VKLKILLLALLAPCTVRSGEEVPKVKPEDMPEFVSVGAVTTFEQLCLLTYSDRERFREWQQKNEGSRLAESRNFKKDATDETYRIATPLVSFVLNASKDNSCSIFSVGTDREVVEKQIEQMLRTYTEQGKGGKLKIEDNSSNGLYGKYFAVLSPEGVSYIEVIFSDVAAKDGVHQTAITGATRRRGSK